MIAEFEIRFFTISQMWIGKRDRGRGYSMSPQYLHFNPSETNEKFVMTGIYCQKAVCLSTAHPVTVRGYTINSLLKLIREYHLINPKRVLDEDTDIIQICEPLLTSSIYIVEEVEEIIKGIAKKLSNGYLSVSNDRFLICLNQEIEKYDYSGD